MFPAIRKFFNRKQSINEEPKNEINLDLGMFAEKDSLVTNQDIPMIIISKKKAKELLKELSRAIAEPDDFIKINLKGDVNPKNEKQDDYSFMKIINSKQQKGL